jgi:hypothetical protein
MFLPYIYSIDCVENIWTQGPEPLRLIGRSLSLLCLVSRHQVSPGCPSAESDTHEACLRTPPAGLEKTGTRAQKSFSDVVLAGTTVLRAENRENSEPP